jgi:hypothetical protein
MAKTSGTTTGAMSSAGKTASIQIPTVTEKYLSAVQSGSFKKLSRTSQVKMLDKVKKELQESVGLPQNFTSKEAGFLDTYASIKYQKINGELRSGKLSAETKKTVSRIDAVLEKNVLKHDIIVYRGTNGSFSSKDKAYTSTSLDVTTASNFSRGDAKLHAYRIPKGTKAVYIGGGEKELLLPRGFDLNKYKVK